MTETVISTNTQINSRIASFSLATGDTNTISLEVITEFTEKEISEVIRENDFRYRVGTSIRETKETVLRTWEEASSYPMRQVSAQELMKLRLSKKPGVVYKKDNTLFYAAIPGHFNLTGRANSLGKHACGEHCTMVCKGCHRTDDLTVAYQQRIHRQKQPFKTAVLKSWRIEKYDFVQEGLESFNMDKQNDSFIVLRCENFQFREVKKQLSTEAVGALKAGLASYVWDDFSGNRTEMIKRMKKHNLIPDRRH